MERSTVMPYSCQTCARRKVKCDKSGPVCSSCRKSNLECQFVAPAPRRRKRNLSGDYSEKLAQYERILKKNNLLPAEEQADDKPRILRTSAGNSVSLRLPTDAMSSTGRLVTGDGKTLYVDSNLWDNIDDVAVHQASDEEDEPQIPSGAEDDSTGDPFSLALMGTPRSLLQFHPSHAHALILWRTHVENVEPLCTVLHIPTSTKMVESVSRNPSSASKSEECLLFAIYHFAVFSLTEAACERLFGQSRASLLQKYHYCTRQALVNANFLKSTEMAIMQAYTLLLIACQSYYDPHTLWILTGVAIRLAQRMGLHRDGEAAGLPAFEVQMRRRLFFQIVPLDGKSSRESGVGIGFTRDQFDTLPPWNVNDSQIWPGMTTKPIEQKGATEMIFCLSRSYIGTSFIKTKQFKGDAEVYKMISETEEEVEELYLRYCEFANPLHLLTNLASRSALNAMRLRINLPRGNERPDTVEIRRERLRLSAKILDTDAAAHAHESVKKYMWYIAPFFAWGTWDALISIATELSRTDLLTQTESDSMWEKVGQLYHNHDEMLLRTRGALQVAIGRLVNKAWDTNPPMSQDPIPDFIVALRSSRRYRYRKTLLDTKQTAGQEHDNAQSQPASFNPSPNEPGSTGISPGFDFDFNYGDLLEHDSLDWMFWDKLINQSRM